MTTATKGDGHQAEFTKDNRYIIGADEDLSPTGLAATTDDGQSFQATSGSDTPQVPLGSELTGTTVYAGRACPGDSAVPAAPDTGGNQIAVVTRVLCTFNEKVAAVQTAGGYEGAVVVNREGGAFGMTVEGTLPTFPSTEAPVTGSSTWAGSTRPPAWPARAATYRAWQWANSVTCSP